MRTLLSSVALALSLSFINVQAADTEGMVNVNNVLAAITADWNDDGSMDRAVLVANPESDGNGVDLYLSLSDDEPNSMKLDLVKKDIAWAGAMFGTLPSLELSGKNSLLVKSANDAIGRDRWNQTLTIAYRDKNFVVAGFTHNAYDTLEPNAKGIQCDINLLTGKGKANGKDITVTEKSPLLKDWKDESVTKVCGIEG